MFTTSSPSISTLFTLTGAPAPSSLSELDKDNLWHGRTVASAAAVASTAAMASAAAVASAGSYYDDRWRMRWRVAVAAASSVTVAAAVASYVHVHDTGRLWRRLVRRLMRAVVHVDGHQRSLGLFRFGRLDLNDVWKPETDSSCQSNRRLPSLKQAAPVSEIPHHKIVVWFDLRSTV